MPFQLRRVDDSFYAAAPIKLQGSAELKAPAAEVWGLLDDLNWVPLARFDWTTPSPHGPGCAAQALVLETLLRR